MSRKNDNRYSNEFKTQIGDLHHSGKPVLKLSSEYGISTVTNILIAGEDIAKAAG